MKKEIIDIWKKFGDNKIFFDILGIPEEFVNDYVEFNKIPKNIKNMIRYPYSLLRHNEIILLISRTSCVIEGLGKNLKKPDKEVTKLFNSMFEKFLKDSWEPLIHRSVQKDMVSKNSGKLCPECGSKKQAKKINDIKIIKNEILRVVESISEKEIIKMEPEYDPEWKCVECGHEWRGAKFTYFLDSDQI